MDYNILVLKSLRGRLILVFLLVSLILILLDRTGAIDPITFPMRGILAPVQLLVANISEKLSYPISYARFVRSGEERIKNLEQRNIELTLKLRDWQDLKQENADLRKQLDVSFSKSHNLVLAKVLGQNRYLQFVVESGHDIREGQVAVYQDNLVGVVVKEGNGIGFLRLISDPDSKIPAKLTSATGIVVGEYASGMVLEKVSKNEILTAGDVVTTSGLEGLVPPGLLIGRIKETTSSKDSLFQQAVVEPLIDVSSITTIFLVD